MNKRANEPMAADIAAQWWWAMQDQTPDGRPNPCADRAARARLRHSDKGAALVDPAFFRLHGALMKAGLAESHDLDPSLRVALVLVHVRYDERKDDQRWRPGFGRAIGAPGFGETNKAPVRPLRFRRLLQAKGEDTDQLVTQFRRIIALVGGKVNVRDLARILFNWDDETRARLAIDYFAAGTAVPTQSCPLLSRDAS